MALLVQRFLVANVLLVGLPAVTALENFLPWYVEATGARLPSPWTHPLNGKHLSHEVKKYGKHDFALICFYSPYCPHCQKFLPHLERVAYGVRHSQVPILVGLVDCTQYLEVCKKYMGEQNDLPGLVFGAVKKWHDPDSLAKVSLPDDTAEEVAAWLNRHLGGAPVHLPSMKDFQEMWRKLLDNAADTAASSAAAVHNLPQADKWDIKLATAMFIRNAVDQLHQSQGLVRSNATRAFSDFVRLLADRYPSDKCRQGFRHLHKIFQANKSIAADELEKKWEMCEDIHWDNFRQGWSSCMGTLPGTRGFTCGLWSLMHTLAARDGSKFSPLQGFTTMRVALWHFFDCQDCKRHFFSMPVNVADAATRQDAQLWWWETHNKVNARLRQEEADSGEGDPGFVKMQWPAPGLCPGCRASSFLTKGRRSLRKATGGGTQDQQAMASNIIEPEAPISWDRDAVVQFLLRYYHAT
mmetsp:Transcript_66163/g.123480  ORF Transcript_66163/g.123480 Transcript_66163/m.123480 type:complete len:467 (+) Transcript_66163:79-1479(+)